MKSQSVVRCFSYISCLVWILNCKVMRLSHYFKNKTEGYFLSIRNHVFFNLFSSSAIYKLLSRTKNGASINRRNCNVPREVVRFFNLIRRASVDKSTEIQLRTDLPKSSLTACQLARRCSTIVQRILSRVYSRGEEKKKKEKRKLGRTRLLDQRADRRAWCFVIYTVVTFSDSIPLAFVDRLTVRACSRRVQTPAKKLA